MDEYQQLVMNFGDDGDIEIESALRPIPFKFSYRFLCDDERCKTPHQLSIIDWELGALVYRLQKKGLSDEEIKTSVKKRYFDELCAPTKDTHFIVGNKWRLVRNRQQDVIGHHADGAGSYRKRHRAIHMKHKAKSLAKAGGFLFCP